jgi:hypothetical protein
VASIVRAMRRIYMIVPLVLVGLTAGGCAKKADPGARGTIGHASPTASGKPPSTKTPITKSPTGTPAGTPTKTPTASATPSRTPPAAHWPSPEDCVSYDPTHLTTHYEAGIFVVLDGVKEVARLQGEPAGHAGVQALALAKNYRKHCFLGRANTQPDSGQFIFDYWRSPTATKTPIPDEYDACSSYDPTNLTLEDLGSGGGWRLKDHDHVLHLFASGSDGSGGLLVASMYHQICFLGVTTDSDLDQLSYFR